MNISRIDLAELEPVFDTFMEIALKAMSEMLDNESSRRREDWGGQRGLTRMGPQQQEKLMEIREADGVDLNHYVEDLSPGQGHEREGREGKGGGTLIAASRSPP